jgi:hypothetical protein
LGIGIRAYARSWGVHHRAIQYAIEQGLIVRLPDGTIDPDQADADWGTLHLARLYPSAAPADPARIDAELDRLYRDPLPSDPETDAHLAQLLRRAADGA